MFVRTENAAEFKRFILLPSHLSASTLRYGYLPLFPHTLQNLLYISLLV